MPIFEVFTLIFFRLRFFIFDNGKKKVCFWSAVVNVSHLATGT